MIVIDGKGKALGRLASYVAKQALKGEEVGVINCEEVIITGNKKMIEEEFFEKRHRFGSSQKGPKHHKTSEKMVKRAIRGMLPNYREGRGRIAFKKIRCYNNIPKELKEIKITESKAVGNKENSKKFSRVKEFAIK